MVYQVLHRSSSLKNTKHTVQEDDETALVHLVERLVAQQRNLRGSEQQFDQAEEPEATGKSYIRQVLENGLD